MTPQWIPLASGPRTSLVAIVLSNLIPVFGVAFLGWDAVQILILYWVENLVIGILTLPRILTAQATDIRQQSPHDPFAQAQVAGLGNRAFTGCFFVVHYGIFCLGHAVFAFMLAADFVEQEGVGGPWRLGPHLWQFRLLLGHPGHCPAQSGRPSARLVDAHEMARGDADG